MAQKYKQVRLQYADGAFEVSWIPEQNAHKNAKLLIGKDKKKALPATVLEVYGDTSLTEEYLSLNEKYPLRKVTDV